MVKDDTMAYLTVVRQQMVFGLGLSVLALLVAPVFLGGGNLPAQTHSPQATKPTHQQKAGVEPAQPDQPAPEAVAAQPPASTTPVLPASKPPNAARVSWDSRGLEIEASNSSLNQILRQVAADTGAKLEGLSQDQRVFGSYGPGAGSGVLLKLLDGSGYNVLIIGGRNADALLKIVLSTRSPVNPNSKANEVDKQLESKLQPDYPPEPPRQQPNQDPFANGEPPRDPQQFMQEILQRQQKIDQQQQDQQNNPQK